MAGLLSRSSVVALGVALIATPALAQTKRFDIAAQPAATGIPELASQADVQVLASEAAVRGHAIHAVHGEMSVEQALGAALAGSGLHVSSAAAHTYMLSADPISAGDPPAGESASDGDIIVTAQKRSERLIDTPQSVTAITSATLEKLHARQFSDFADTVPGLSYQSAGPGQSLITLRGVTTGADVSPTVGIYVDDVPFGSSSSFTRSSTLALDLGLFDVDQIEVLRGPQGTLYGSSTMGGLIKYVSKKPDTHKFGIDAEAGVSDTHDGGVNYDGAAVVNLPIVEDKVALRVTGYYSRDAGYIDNIARNDKNANASRVYGGRADLLVTPTEKLTIRLGGYIQDIHRDGIATADYTPGGDPIYGSLKQDRPMAEPFNQRFRLVSGTVAYDFGFATLTSISSYQTVHTDYTVDYSASYVPLLSSLGYGSFKAVGNHNIEQTHKFTQEVRLASQDNQPLTWLIGGYFTSETAKNSQGFSLLDTDGNAVPNTLFTYDVPSLYREAAVFADATYHVTSRIDVSGGIRYANIHQRTEQFGTGPLGSSAPLRTTDNNVVTYLANARYRLGNHASAYFRYATGYRPGGPNAVLNDPTTGLPFAPASFKPDHLQSYEVGFRGETKDRTFSADVSGYYINWDDIQILTSRNGFGVIANAASGATVRGAELTLTARPVRSFTVTGSFAYQDAHLSQADADLGAYKGERLPNVPRFTAALTTDYDFSQTGLRPTIGATLRYVSDRMASFDQSNSVPQYDLPSYVRVDMRAGITVHQVQAQLYVHNLFDVRSQLISPTFGSDFGGPIQIAIMEPRTIGLNLSTHF